MNYLAHGYIAHLTATSQVGSLMGDFVRGPLEGNYPAAIERGIRLHRRIDSYTDTHPVVIGAKRRMAPPYRRYAGILLDVFFDHYLARDWGNYHSQTLEQFADAFYRQLGENSHLFDERLQLSLEYMRERNLLLSYREISGIEHALSGLSTRLSRPNPLADGGVVLRNQYVELEADFSAFFPDLIHYAQNAAKNV